jgi:hypothetical protein
MRTNDAGSEGVEEHAFRRALACPKKRKGALAPKQKTRATARVQSQKKD